MSLFEEILEIRSDIILGIYLMMLGGWFDFVFMYIGWLFGFENGLKESLLRSNVTSRKFTTFKFVSMVIFSWNSSLNNLVIFFLRLSDRGPDKLRKQQRPSSRYNPHVSTPYKFFSSLSSFLLCFLFYCVIICYVIMLLYVMFVTLATD